MRNILTVFPIKQNIYHISFASPEFIFKGNGKNPLANLSIIKIPKNLSILQSHVIPQFSNQKQRA